MSAKRIQKSYTVSQVYWGISSLAEQLTRRLTEHCKKNQKSESSVIREAVKIYLDNIESVSPEIKN